VEWEHASESIRLEVGAVFGHYGRFAPLRPAYGALGHACPV
jgi:hypothetical protein